MIPFVLKKIFGTKNERELKRMQPQVVRINALEPSFKSLSDTELKSKTAAFRERVARGETLDALLPEAFACVREASCRVLQLRHFNSQLVGGMVLHSGKISEMKTGEGKTLVATLPVYLNSLTGKGVHVVTVNDYLARRDSEWMGQIYQFLGLSVGVIVHGLNDEERKASYGCDVTYGTNNEFGFDYLRDNMKYDLANYVQRDLNYAIVDEVDSILIDEARTPLIISGPAEQSTELYNTIDRIVPALKKETHFTIDEKARSVMLTEAGVVAVEERLNIPNLYEPQNITLLHHVNQALRAHTLYRLDVDYVVKDDKVTIVDEFTGRLMPGRRWSDGLHQAVEAKEGVTIENENQTLASITFQNYFRMYNKLAGMTGTADTEAAEFAKIYNLEVLVVPTNREMIREDHADVIYKTEAEKFRAVVKEIEECHKKGQPTLVGTISIEKSEHIAEMLKRRGVPHHVLNAKQHEREAEIVAQAGRFGAVTISTNMAGRGTDIMLGGNPEFLAKASGSENIEPFRVQCAGEKEKVISAGGLHIIGTERHESRRIDNQLRGRSGRQGDPGSSRFYLSLDDDLLRIFGGERISKLMERFGLKEDEEIQHPWLSRAIENAQKKVEAHNFSIRKNVLEYDDVMNLQRKTVYQRRREILGASDTKDIFLDMTDQVATQLIDASSSEDFKEQVKQVFGMEWNREESPDEKERESFGKKFYDHLVDVYGEKEKEYGRELFSRVEKFLVLSTLDTLWKDHLLTMDHLREGIGLRGYGQKDPLLEYKREGYGLFRAVMDRFATESVQKVFHVKISQEKEAPQLRQREQPLQMRRGKIEESPVKASFAGREAEFEGSKNLRSPMIQTIRNTTPKVGRNDPCHCGSGKKYKKCHGA